VQLCLQNGLIALVAADRPDYELILRNAESSQRLEQPVGIILDLAGHLLDFNYTYQSLVRYAQDDEDDPNRVAVGFWGYGPLCYLTRDHPEFERIKRTLDEAVAAGSMVWFANESQMVESETEIWWKLMDVRPKPPRREAQKAAEPPGKNGP
jgi:hypothetical protein